MPARLGMGVTRNAVIGKVHRLNLSGRAHRSRDRRNRAHPRKQRNPACPAGRQWHAVHADCRQMRAETYVRAEPIQRQIALPEPQPLRLVDLPKGGRVTILHLSDKTCKWPIGDPGTEDFCFCGHSPRDSSPYCEYHARPPISPCRTAATGSLGNRSLVHMPVTRASLSAVRIRRS